LRVFHGSALRGWYSTQCHDLVADQARVHQFVRNFPLEELPELLTIRATNCTGVRTIGDHRGILETQVFVEAGHEVLQALRVSLPGLRHLSPQLKKVAAVGFNPEQPNHRLPQQYPTLRLPSLPASRCGGKLPSNREVNGRDRES